MWGWWAGQLRGGERLQSCLTGGVQGGLPVGDVGGSAADERGLVHRGGDTITHTHTHTHTHLYLVDFGKYLSVSQGNNLLFSTKGLDKHKKVSYKDLAWGLEHVLFITHFHHSILSVECSSLGSIP